MNGQITAWMKLSFKVVWLFFNGVIWRSIPQPREEEGEKKKKKIKKLLRKKNILRNTRNYKTQSFWTTEIMGKQDENRTVFSVFSYKLKQETKHRFYINFF